MLKALVRTKKACRVSRFVIDETIVESELDKILDDNVCFVQNGLQLNSTLPGVPKYLHWFEWEKRDLHLYDVTANSHRTIKLAIYFKIPPFSRSVMTPDGRIFLLGGEDPDHGPRKEVFFLNVS